MKTTSSDYSSSFSYCYAQKRR